MTSSAADAALGLLDWRRRVFLLYAEVRAADPPAGHARWRAERDHLLANHPQSPLPLSRRPRFAGLPVPAYDAAWRFEVPVDNAEPERIDVPTATDGVVGFERAGVVRLAGIGRLDVWALRSYGGGLFVPLRDRTAGRTTYGGGRYLLDTVKGADLGGTFDPTTGTGTLVLDFNFAYHPSCAYDAAWACPLAPPGNVLDVEVPVGEHMPPGGWY